MDNIAFIGGSGDLVDIQERCEQVCCGCFTQFSNDLLGFQLCLLIIQHVPIIAAVVEIYN